MNSSKSKGDNKMRRKLNYLIISLVLIVMSGSSNGLHASATDGRFNIANQNSEKIDYKALEQYEEIGLEDKELTNPDIKSIPGVIEDIRISGIVRYAQAGQSWSNNIMQSCGKTIGDAGCAVTSLAIINRKYNTTRNPGQMNTYLGTIACPLSWTSAASRLGLSYQKLYQHSTGVNISVVHTILRGVLRNSRPILLGMKTASGNTHYVVVKSYYQLDNGYYSFGVSDPGSSNRTTLDQLVNDGWRIIQIHVYF